MVMGLVPDVVPVTVKPVVVPAFPPTAKVYPSDTVLRVEATFAWVAVDAEVRAGAVADVVADDDEVGEAQPTSKRAVAKKLAVKEIKFLITIKLLKQAI